MDNCRATDESKRPIHWSSRRVTGCCAYGFWGECASFPAGHWLRHLHTSLPREFQTSSPTDFGLVPTVHAPGTEDSDSGGEGRPGDSSDPGRHQGQHGHGVYGQCPIHGSADRTGGDDIPCTIRSCSWFTWNVTSIANLNPPRNC